MSQQYKDLKTSSLQLLKQKEGTDTSTEISKEDMHLIDSSHNNIFLLPLYSFAGSLLFASGLKLLTKPGWFQNPLIPDERLFYKRKFFKYFMSNHMVFVCTLGGFVLGFVKYELCKFYLYLKYRRLINCYQDAQEKVYLQSLKQAGMDAEKTVTFK